MIVHVVTYEGNFDIDVDDVQVHDSVVAFVKDGFAVAMVNLNSFSRYEQKVVVESE